MNEWIWRREEIYYQTTERKKKFSAQNELIPVEGSSVVFLTIDKLNQKFGKSRENNSYFDNYKVP